MAEHRTRVGLHARNALHFTEPDYALIRQARIETLKTMSLMDIRVYERLRRENPGLEFIVRLYDERISPGSRPSPASFVARMVPIINRLKPYARKFEIHNEPNHRERVEGWGEGDVDAHAFLAWYMQVLFALKRACPWAEFGFPGLAPSHRDLVWLDICREAIRASAWLGCHCYWQYNNMTNDQWGLRFKLYHQRFPTMRIEITEFGNSTPPPQVSREQIATQYAQYYQELNKYPYLGSASAFIASSPDPQWAQFVWMKEGGEMLPVVRSVAGMERKPVHVEPVPTPEPAPKPGKISRPPIQDLVDRLPKHKTKTYGTRPTGDITTLVIHHSATVATITPQRIAEYHVAKLDWPGIGYHFLVGADGTIYQGNKVETVSYHATKANPFGVGICFLGNFTEGVPPPAQLRAGAQLVAWLMQELYIDLDNVEGHLKFTATACPGNQWLKGLQWKQLLRQEVVKAQSERA